MDVQSCCSHCSHCSLCSHCSSCGDDILVKFPLTCKSCNKIVCLFCINDSCICKSCSKFPACFICNTTSGKLNENGYCTRCIEENAQCLLCNAPGRVDEKGNCGMCASNLAKCRSCGGHYLSYTEWYTAKNTGFCDDCTKIVQKLNHDIKNINNSNLEPLKNIADLSPTLFKTPVARVEPKEKSSEFWKNY